MSALVAVVLAGCDGGYSPAKISAPAESDNSASAIDQVCRNLKFASTNGNETILAALSSTKEGSDYSGDVIKALKKQRGYKFLGAEFLDGTCWVYSEAKGIVAGRPIELSWRCPMKGYSQRMVRQVPETTLELAEDRQCDFGFRLGDPPRRRVSVDVFEM